MVRLGTGRDAVNAAPSYRQAMHRAANPPGAGSFPIPGADGEGHVGVVVPRDGHVDVRKIDNGVVATAHDADWNKTAEVHAPSAGHVHLKDCP